MPFSYFVIQFNIKTFGKKYDLIIRLFNIIFHYMNELALRALWFVIFLYFFKVEPLIQEGRNGLIHHMLVYKCKASFNDSALFYSGSCFNPKMPRDFITDCKHNEIAAGWAIGSEVRANHMMLNKLRTKIRYLNVYLLIIYDFI